MKQTLCNNNDNINSMQCPHLQESYTKVRRDGQMSWASISQFGRSRDLSVMGLNLVKSNQWLKNVYMSLPGLACIIIRIGKGAVEWGRPTVQDWNFPCLINYFTTTNTEPYGGSMVCDLSISVPARPEFDLQICFCSSFIWIKSTFK